MVLLYQQNQRLAQNNQFYVVLTNTFAPDEDCIQHYIAKPKLAKTKLQRCPIKPISFRSSNGPVLSKTDHPFSIMTEWGFAETTNYLVLYWPKQFDFVKYYLSKLLKRQYEAEVQRDIFVSTKNKDYDVFYEVAAEGLEFVPRWGCSTLVLDDQIFMFGGFYDRQNSYLNLQNQISTLDLTDF